MDSIGLVTLSWTDNGNGSIYNKNNVDNITKHIIQLYIYIYITKTKSITTYINKSQVIIKYPFHP